MAIHGRRYVATAGRERVRFFAMGRFKASPHRTFDLAPSPQPLSGGERGSNSSYFNIAVSLSSCAR